MKLIKPSFEILDFDEYYCEQSIYDMIELAGRTCYKSENRIQYDENGHSSTAKDFVDMLCKKEHTAMLEHGTVYLKFNNDNDSYLRSTKYERNPYSKVYKLISPSKLISKTNESYVEYFITTNFRVIVQNGWFSDLQYLCKPTEYHYKRTTVRFICDRGVSHEFVRHRTFSFAQESTRYCNYSKDKFNNELVFIIPCWLDKEILDGSIYNYYDCIDEWQKSENANLSNFLQSISFAEANYLMLLHNKWTPQQARAVLPNSIKTELVMTGFIEDWKEFFKLRCNKNAHPQARELAIPLKEEFKNKYDL